MFIKDDRQGIVIKLFIYFFLFVLVCSIMDTKCVKLFKRIPTIMAKRIDEIVRLYRTFWKHIHTLCPKDLTLTRLINIKGPGTIQWTTYRQDVNRLQSGFMCLRVIRQ